MGLDRAPIEFQKLGFFKPPNGQFPLILFFSGSCTQQPDRADNWEEWGNNQEDHGGHGHQDYRQLHQRHLLLQP